MGTGKKRRAVRLDSDDEGEPKRARDEGDEAPEVEGEGRVLDAEAAQPDSSDDDIAPDSKRYADGERRSGARLDAWRHYSTVQVQCSAVRYSTVEYSALQYSTVQCITVQYSVVQHSTVPYSTVQCSAAQYSTVQYSAV